MNHFRHYLFRQLKGEGMKIYMKEREGMFWTVDCIFRCGKHYIRKSCNREKCSNCSGSIVTKDVPDGMIICI